MPLAQISDITAIKAPPAPRRARAKTITKQPLLMKKQAFTPLLPVLTFFSLIGKGKTLGKRALSAVKFLYSSKVYTSLSANARDYAPHRLPRAPPALRDMPLLLFGNLCRDCELKKRDSLDSRPGRVENLIGPSGRKGAIP
jgi:hypothetical protein